MEGLVTTATETLPPYLRRSPNGRLQLVLHATGVQTYKVCPMKFQLRTGWEIERAVPRAALNYGGAIHAVLAHRYTHLGDSLATVEAAQMELLHAWFTDAPQPDDEWRTCGRAQSAICAYNAEWPAHEWEVLGVEEEFERVVGEIVDPVTGEPVDSVLAGRKDLVVAWHDCLWVVDHKTCSEWGEDLARNQQLLGDRRSFQFRAYAWEERERRLKRLADDHLVDDIRLAPVRGVIGNYLVGRRPFSEDPAAVARRTASAKPRDQFHQEPYVFDDATLDEWREEMLLVATRILRDWRAQRWEQSFDRGCAHYGRCEYYDYCEESPARREAVLASSLYRHAEPRRVATGEVEP